MSGSPFEAVEKQRVILEFRGSACNLQSPVSDNHPQWRGRAIGFFPSRPHREAGRPSWVMLDLPPPAEPRRARHPAQLAPMSSRDVQRVCILEYLCVVGTIVNTKPPRPRHRPQPPSLPPNARQDGRKRVEASTEVSRRPRTVTHKPALCVCRSTQQPDHQPLHTNYIPPPDVRRTRARLQT